ncbi:MAG: hypothetical protein LBF15_07215 [Candidatus Peribacteria bacterium]|jgi:cupin superfamily acireductone dioxygenase involved in methionine salvage|nr:hypothetical protein [Candidatus Peribacteria bacterium]
MSGVSVSMDIQENSRLNGILNKRREKTAERINHYLVEIKEIMETYKILVEDLVNEPKSSPEVNELMKKYRRLRRRIRFNV